MATKPRRYLAGLIWLCSCRCLERRFFFRPDGSLNLIFLYALARYAHMYGIKVHAVICMSNHYHLVFTDVHGVAGRFLQAFNSTLSRSVNCLRGRNDHLFCAEEPSMVELPRRREDMIARIAYVITNPVEAGLVSQAKHWPGVVSLPNELGVRRIKLERPRHFFDPSGQMPKQVTFETVVPDGMDVDADAFRNELAVAVKTLETAKQEAMSVAGRKFLGAKRVRRQSWNSAPATESGFRKLSPRVAALEKRVRDAMLASNRAFVAAHARIKKSLFDSSAIGSTQLFPAGTVAAVDKYGFSPEPILEDSHWLPFLTDP